MDQQGRAWEVILKKEWRKQQFLGTGALDFRWVSCTPEREFHGFSEAC